MVRVGLVGCGTIGEQLARTIQRRYPHAARLVALHDTNTARARRVQRSLRAPRPALVALTPLIRRCDLILEAASVDAARRVLPAALRAHRTVLVMSVGALLTDRAWRQALRRSRGRVLIPSGALAGLDGVRAMAAGQIARVTLTTSKPPRALAASPYVRHRYPQIASWRRPRVLFRGSPRQAVKAFPQNINVAAALALAAGRFGARARIIIAADPRLRGNRHEVLVEGDTGRIRCTVESRASRNPKTSLLAVRSAVTALGRLFDQVAIPT